MSILGPETVDLQVSCMCNRSGIVPWQQLRRRCGIGHLYRLGFHLLRMHRMGRKRLGIERWSRQMCFWGELPWLFIPLALPRALTGPAARLLLREVPRLVVRGDPWRLRWLQARLRPAQAAARTFAHERFTMSYVCRTSETSRLDHVPPERLEEALRRRDMRRYELYWKLPMYQSSTALWHEGAAAVAD